MAKSGVFAHPHQRRQLRAIKLTCRHPTTTTTTSRCSSSSSTTTTTTLVIVLMQAVLMLKFALKSDKLTLSEKHRE